jgi:hypothetical protein
MFERGRLIHAVTQKGGSQDLNLEKDGDAVSNHVTAHAVPSIRFTELRGIQWWWRGNWSVRNDRSQSRVAGWQRTLPLIKQPATTVCHAAVEPVLPPESRAFEALPSSTAIQFGPSPEQSSAHQQKYWLGNQQPQAPKCPCFQVFFSLLAHQALEDEKDFPNSQISFLVFFF